LPRPTERREQDGREAVRRRDSVRRRLPLYKGKTRVGGLGLSGDTSCTDREIAKRVRHLANLDPEQGEFADDIVFTGADGPPVFAHPLCENTCRNGKKIGDETKASGY